MKKIEAIIKPFKLDEVREALSEIGITGLPSCTAVPSMWSISCPRSRSKWWSVSNTSMQPLKRSSRLHALARSAMAKSS